MERVNSVHGSRIAIIGLGYVGQPLAVEYGKKRQTIGFDINSERINSLKRGIDETLEVEKDSFDAAKNLIFSNDEEDLADCDIYIVTVPTPIDEINNPNLKPIISATKTVAKFLNVGNYVIYESTVYPGCTEEVCVPLLEKGANLKLNKDFYCGYSPERINPGDKNNTITKITKVVSGSNDTALKNINDLYSEIITAGTFQASSIKVAEAAKVIENTQRDVNIALINELSIIFDKLNIDTMDVLETAQSKWNFLPFKPGLVGGHCIGVDPYYLTHKARSIGYNPEIITAGREMNDGMAKYFASKFVEEMGGKNIKVLGAKVLVMGLAFKENCPDLRNTKVVDLVSELESYGINVEVTDPWCSAEESKKIYNIELITKLEENRYDGVFIAVAHNEFKELSHAGISLLCKNKHIIFDLKYLFRDN